MRKFFILVLCLSMLVIMAIALTGCATPGKTFTSYKAADPYEVINEKYVDTTPSIVWDDLVRELSKSYFMINNIDKESRIINVSFESDEVTKYVDCGSYDTIVKKSMINKIGNERYRGKICERSSLIIETSHNSLGYPAPVIVKVRRYPKLEGRMNVYIAPKGNGTLVTVNCRYIMTVIIKENRTYYAPAGNPVRADIKTDSYTCILDSKRPSPCTPICVDDLILVCYSIGKLEREILSLVK